jgi:hydrogenase-4 component B
LLASSGVPGLFTPRRSMAGQHVATAMTVAGSALGLAAAIGGLMGRVVGTAVLPGPVSTMSFHFRLDPLGAFFLVPIFVLGALGSIYGTAYWRQATHPRTGPRLRLCYGLLIASMALVVLASDAISFLFAWEVMALSAFFLVSTEDHKRQVRDAGWLYLVATHVSTLVLFGLFALWRVAAGTFEFTAMEQASPGIHTAIFVAALVGFGLKAGMMPLHFWLPSAHANAPSHISAILSGVLLKIGIYGLLRTLTLLPPPLAGWGGATLLLGTLSAVGGVLFALGQHDLKRLLAYHSVENIGIILMGLGLALIGQASGRTDWVVLGMAGCLLHVWNHALFKSLLFFGAGSVVHAMHTREIDRMGGLAKRQPRTALLFFIGALAICGLPPLNGFLSEFFIYLGLFRALELSSEATLAVPALALVGALAVACFVKAFGAVFLGSPRTSAAERAVDSGWSMVLPMGILASCCIAIGVLPPLVMTPLGAVIGQWTARMGDAQSLAALAPIAALTRVMLGLTGTLLLAALAARMRSKTLRRSVTWDCGYALPNARMQYTASSFSAMLVTLSRGLLRPRTHRPVIKELFPGRAEFHSHVDDVVLDRWLVPQWSYVRLRLGRLRVFQQGSVQRYVLYILVTVFLLLLWSVPW